VPLSGQKVVLIVDDTPTNVAVISGLLEDSFRIKVATNGETALAIAQATDKPDLILLDVEMPGMTRWSFPIPRSARCAWR